MSNIPLQWFIMIYGAITSFSCWHSSHCLHIILCFESSDRLGQVGENLIIANYLLNYTQQSVGQKNETVQEANSV